MRLFPNPWTWQSREATALERRLLRRSAGNITALVCGLALLTSCSGTLDGEPSPSAPHGNVGSASNPTDGGLVVPASDASAHDAPTRPKQQEQGAKSDEGEASADAPAEGTGTPDTGTPGNSKSPGGSAETADTEPGDRAPASIDEPQSGERQSRLVRRLSNQELANTLASFADIDPQLVMQALPTDSHTHLFDRIARDQSISTFHLEGYERLTKNVIAALLESHQLDQLSAACSDEATPPAYEARSLEMNGSALALEPAWALCNAGACTGDSAYTLYSDEVTATTNQALEAPGTYQITLDLQPRQAVEVALKIDGESVQTWQLQAGATTLESSQQLDAGAHLFEYELRFRSAAQTQTHFTRWSLRGPIQTSSVSDAEQSACLTGLIEDFAPRAFRRPLSVEQQQRLATLAEETRKDLGYQASVYSLLHAILESPYALYHVETGAKESKPFEIANRLAYALWEAPPDQALLEDARAARLDEARVREHAQRLSQSPQALRTAQRFFLQWMALKDLASLTKDPAVLPAFNDNLGSAMRQEFERFIEGVVWEREAPARELLLADYSWVPEQLAVIYSNGVAATSELVTVEPERAGLLTLPAVLATHAKFDETSPVLRGVFVLRNFLCVNMPPPPATLDITPPPFDANKTTRERWAAHSSTPGCAGCHDSIDPIGFALEGFDALGQVRTEENGHEIDTRGGAVPLGIGPLELSGARELGEAIAESSEWHECLTRQWLNFMRGSLHQSNDALVQRLTPAPNDDIPLKTMFIEAAIAHALGE